MQRESDFREELFESTVFFITLASLSTAGSLSLSLSPKPFRTAEFLCYFSRVFSGLGNAVGCCSEGSTPSPTHSALHCIDPMFRVHDHGRRAWWPGKSINHWKFPLFGLFIGFVALIFHPIMAILG